MTPQWPGSLVLAGAGKMGGALLRGWLASGLQPSAIHVIDPHLDPAIETLCRRHAIALNAPSSPPDVLVLAIKPQTLSSAAEKFAPLGGPETLIISILAGKTIATLRTGLPEAGAIVRAMPNLPASIGRGATAVSAEPHLSPTQRAMAQSLLEAVGLVEWLDEDLIDAVTAVSGSGPAYVFALTESLAEAGAGAGLPPEVAARLARATVEGAAALMTAESDRSPTALRDAVTSPGGTTAAALEVLCAEDGLAPLLTRAVAAAKKRAGALSD